MNDSVIIAFNATVFQRDEIVRFCQEKIGCEHIIAIGLPINRTQALAISLFEHRPDVYFGIISTETLEVIENATIDDDVLLKALKELDRKYAFATTRKSPVANDNYVLAWVHYINNGKPKTRTSLRTEVLEEHDDLKP